MADVQLGPTATKVLEVMRQNRGVPYAADDLCEMVDCSTGQAQVALASLAQAGLVDQQQSASGKTMYVARN